MAQLRGQIKRSILNSIARQAKTQQVELADALGAYQDALIAGVKGGRLFDTVSQAGHSTRFRVPVIGENFTQTDVAELAQEYLEVYADSVIVLANAGNASPNDDQILATMLADDRLQSVTRLRHDYTLANWPGIT